MMTKWSRQWWCTSLHLVSVQWKKNDLCVQSLLDGAGTWMQDGCYVQKCYLGKILIQVVTGRQHSFVMAWKMGWRRGGRSRWRVRQNNFTQITVTMFVIHYSGSKWSFHENRNKTTLRGSCLSNSVLLYATKFWSFTVCLFLVINNLNKQIIREKKWTIVWCFQLFFIQI